MSQPRDLISIEGLAVDCVVGVYPNERDRPQPLRVDLQLALETAEAGETERFASTVDYALVASQIGFVLQHGRFHMLETAARVLARLLLAAPAKGERRAAIQEVRLRLSKPLALGGHGVPSLEIHRTSEDVGPLAEEQPEFGTVDVVDETKELGVYRLNIAPHRGIPLHVHRRMQEAELILTEGLLVNGVKVAPGTAFRWPKDSPHRHDNPTDRWQTILCIDSPPFLRDDEIAVEGEPADVRPEPPFIPTMPR